MSYGYRLAVFIGASCVSTEPRESQARAIAAARFATRQNTPRRAIRLRASPTFAANQGEPTMVAPQFRFAGVRAAKYFF